MIGFGKDNIENKLINFLKQELPSKDERFRFLEIYIRVVDNIVMDSNLKMGCKTIDADCICYAKQKAYMSIVDNIRNNKVNDYG